MESSNNHVVVGSQSCFADCKSEFIDIFFGCPVSLTDVVELSDGFFFLVFIEKGSLEGCEEYCLGQPSIRSISLFDCRFVGREVFVRTSFKEWIACVNEIIDLLSQYFTMPPHSTWNPCGTDLFHVESMESTWNMFHHINHVLTDMDSIWNPYGIHMESTWNPHGLIPHGIHLKSMWIPYGFHVECT